MPDRVKKPDLDYIFHPRSIAVAGVADNLDRPNIGKIFTRIFIDAGFKGPIYPLNPNGGEAYGLKVYPSLRDVPGPVDYVVSAIPAQFTPQLMSDCASISVKLVHFFTAGFSELGNEASRKLQEEVIAIARRSGVRVTGPNGMGLYCPASGLSFSASFPKESGTVGFLSQSGGNSMYLVNEVTPRGVYFSKVVSYGNAGDLNETDFLEYFRDDPQTEIIAAYIEGVNDGRRFFRVLKETAAKKPVVVCKGGRTESGVRTAASHTGAIAGDHHVWSTVLKQAGVIQVQNIDELADVVLLLRFLSPPAGNSTAIIGIGGGASVYAADECSSAGLMVPPLSPEIRESLKKIYPTEAGSIFRNPIDLSPLGGKAPIQSAIKLIAEWDQADLLLLHIPFDINPGVGEVMLRPYIESLTALAEKVRKRTAIVLHSPVFSPSLRRANEVQSVLSRAGYAVIPSTSRAATALGKLVQYYQRRRTD